MLKRLSDRSPPDQSDHLLLEALQSLTSLKVTARTEKLDRALHLLANKFGDGVYAKYFEISFQVHLELQEAKKHWEELVRHHDEIGARSGVALNFYASALDYLVRKARLIENPVLVDREKFEQIRQDTMTDAMTGLYNFRYFQKVLPREVERARRYNTPCSLLFFDVDHFKNLNDEFGHMIGDEILRNVAQAIHRSVRSYDMVFRYGGEEFVVIAPQTDREGARLLAERIRLSVATLRISALNRVKVGITVSGGVAAFPLDARSETELVRKADDALYEAKTRGRNRISAFEGDERIHPRFTAEVPVLICSDPSHREVSKTKNLSAGGMMLEAPGPLEVGAVIHLEISLGSDSVPVRCTGTVTHVRPMCGESAYEVGIHIAQMADFDWTRYTEFIATQAA